jgi:hypothetical protein
MNLKLLGQLLNRHPLTVSGDELCDLCLAQAVLALPRTTRGTAWPP